MPRFLPIGKEAKGAAGFLLAALPALGALLTALAISGDLIGRMARNHPLASFGAFGPDGSGEIEHTVNLSLPAGDFDDLGARAWVATSPALVTRAAIQPVASACTFHGRRSARSSPSSGRRSSECRDSWSGSGLATCRSARPAG